MAGNEMTRPTASAMTMPADKNVFEAYADSVNRNRIVGEMLKFRKGEWVTGRDGDEVEEGTELIAGCDGLEIGWIKWEEQKPVEYKTGRLVDGFIPMKRSELGDDNELYWPRDDMTGQPRDPWQFSNSMVFMDPETKQLFTFPTASKGGIGAVGKLMGMFGKHVRGAPTQLPIVALLSDSYKHPNKQLGKVYTPLFKITGWVERGPFDEAMGAEAEVAAAAADAGEPEPVEEPKGKKGKGDTSPRPHKDYAAAKSGEKPSGKRARLYKGESDHEVPF